jgi:hypothetical protein
MSKMREVSSARVVAGRNMFDENDTTEPFANAGGAGVPAFLKMIA